MHTVRALNGLAIGVRALRAAVAGGRCRVYAVSCAVWVVMPRLYRYFPEMEVASPLLYFSHVLCVYFSLLTCSDLRLLLSIHYILHPKYTSRVREAR
jgi:hypothetical protein